MTLTRKLTGDSSTLSQVPGVSEIVTKQLLNFKKEIEDKTITDNFKTSGIKIPGDRAARGKIRFRSSSVVNGKIVPRGIVDGYIECEKGLDNTAAAETSLNSLVEFVSIMTHRAERNHNGCDPRSQAFYVALASKGNGKTIFPDNEVIAAAFDKLVADRLIEMRAKFLHANKHPVQKMLIKMRLATSDKKREEFMKKVDVDQQKLLKVKNIITSLQEEKIDNPYISEGLNLLFAILVRSLSAYSRTNLDTYRNDFIKTLIVIAPGRPTNSERSQINDFFDYHSKLITSISDRKKKLYLDGAVNVLITALCIAGVGEMLIPANLIQNPVLQSLALNVAPELTEEFIDEKHFFHDRYKAAMPILIPPGEQTNSEIYKRWVNKEKAAHILIVGGTITAGILTGGVGVAVAGGIGLVFYAGKFVIDYNKFRELSKIEKNSKADHEQQYCEFFNKIRNDVAHCKSMQLYDIIFADLNERTSKLSKKVGTTSTANMLGRMGSAQPTPAVVASVVATTTSTVTAMSPVVTTPATTATSLTPSTTIATTASTATATTTVMPKINFSP